MSSIADNGKQKKKNIIWKIILLISVLVIAACIIVIVNMYMPDDNDMSEYKKTTAETSSTTESTEETTEPELPENPIDFDTLQEENSDIYAWITVPNTLVDYPVLQSDADTSDSFYLDHNMYKEYEYAGSIYSQKMNSTDFSDPVTVLYGHNMKNKSMFGSLHYFEDEDFFEENEVFYVYMPGHILTYEIVAAYVYDDRHIMNTFDFTDEVEFQQYIDSILEPKSMTQNVREGAEITTESNILTLSTCNGNSSQRYLVQGVLIKDELTK